MAGSHAPAAPLSPFADPILAARVEALRQLADGLTDRVAVMDRELNVVYANDAAWGSQGSRRPEPNRPSVMNRSFR